MSITRIDPVSALIAIDLQNGILAVAEAEDARRIVERTAELAEAFHAAGLPVIWVTALGRPAGRTEVPLPGGKPQADFAVLDERLPVTETDLRVAKKALSAFTSAEVTGLLADRAVTNVVVTGIATGMGVESTARAAYDAGYSVTVPTDAVTDLNAERNRLSLTLTLPAIAETGTTADVLAALRRTRA
ncbi:cysteine hydrolase family protein [Nocardia sp. NPDC058497]|uniref:cysteine hydrolase family protein n=1 Tax=Nocardia sp. NPDC058497 TaxID=3346529 RepID=UPI0036471896